MTSFPRGRKRLQNRFKNWDKRIKSLGKRSKRRRNIKVLSLVTTIVFVGVLFFGASGVAAVVLFSRNLPSPDRLTEREVRQTTKIFSRQGDVLYEIFDEQQRTLIKLEDIPEDLIEATLSAEDRDFYRHSGFDVRGIVRSAYRIVTRGQIMGGGSTITQQLVKNVFLSPETTFTRKLREIILAVRLEATYSKEEILQMYFNEVAYGGNYYGVGAAAEGYYGKHVRDLTLEESVFLAGLPQAPSVYSPRSGDPDLSLARYNLVLDLMVKDGVIDAERAQEAKEFEILSQVKPMGNNIKAPHFVFYVKQELVRQFGEKLVEQGGLRVTTTLDMDKQVIAEEEVRFQIERLAQQRANANNQALISISPKTGEILAMVGSVNYFDESIDGNVNVITSRRQPGSAIKPIVYVKGFQMGYSPATFLPDIYACFGKQADGTDYCPSNSDGRYWGPMLAREALANSRNTPAVRMGQLVGVQNMIAQAEELGITTFDTPDRYGVSLALGAGEVKPIELVNAYSAFANEGQQHDLVSVLKVEDSTGKVIFENKPADRTPRRVLPAEYAYLITDILADNESRQRLFGANNLLQIGRPAGVKTGTTNDNKDAWTCGYVPQLATCVWTGNTDSTPMSQTIQGSTGATPTFHHYMRRALADTPVEEFTRPDSISRIIVDRLSGKLPQSGSSLPTRPELFAKGTEPTEIDDFHTTVEVCRSRGLLATEYHRHIGDVENRTFTYVKELNPAWQQYADEWMNGADGYGKPPEQTCPIVNQDGEPLTGPYVQITSPRDRANITGTSFDVKVQAYSEHRILKVEFYWDNTLVKTLTSSPYETTISVSNDVQGTHTVRVVAYDGRGEQSEDRIEVEFPTASPTPTPSSSGSGSLLPIIDL